MAEQVTLILPDGLAMPMREVAALTQRGLEDVLQAEASQVALERRLQEWLG